MSTRTWISLGTVLLLGIIVFLSRHEIWHAWKLLDHVNGWLLLLLLPLQVMAYFIAGEMMFAYLRDKKATQKISLIEQARIALEVNFVNHILPSGGVSGISYASWRLSNLGVSAARVTVAQLIRFAAAFAAYITLLVLAVLAITADGHVNRWILLLSSFVVFMMISTVLIGMYVVSNLRRARSIGRQLATVCNTTVRFFSLGKKQSIVKTTTIVTFLEQVHEEYLTLKREKKILIKPYLWGIVFTILDVMVFVVTYWALGYSVNPAPILIAYGLATMVGIFAATPGGAGAYEAIMVSFLAIAGVPAGVAIAGTLLARVILLLGTILFGYFFYQYALEKYGKPKLTN